MDENKKPSAKCGDVLHKSSSVLSFISMLLIVALFLRMESINRKTEINELRISIVERCTDPRELQTPQSADQKDEMKTSENAQNAIAAHHRKNRRDVAQTQNSSTISLHQVRKEIDKKLSQVCSTTDKICQAGPQGPPGDPGAHGYPGYKGEKGAPGKSGPQGPLGPTGDQGPRGKLGPRGPQGIKGEMGKKGHLGSPGVKGDVGPMGRPGEKGSIGLKGHKGNKGSIGVQGPKGECIISPKVNVVPVSLEVFVSETAKFYCWVDGQTSKRITWRKIGGALLKDTTLQDGILRINNVQRSHVGSYVCTVYTSYGILKAISRLRIKEPPVITNKPSSQVSVATGPALMLCCRATGSPSPKIQWLRSDQSSDSTLLFHDQGNGCLQVNTVNFDIDGVLYICRATNSIGIAETTTLVLGRWTFTARGRSGRFGSIQSFTVPRSTRYLIKAWGARGGTHSYNYGFKPGTYYGGKGAYIEGKFRLTKGTVLNIVVGQRGGDSVEVKGGQSTTQTAAELGLSVEDQAGTGGGGGSFVYTTSNVLLLAAGGGGGASTGYNGVDGQSGTSGTSSVGKDSSHVRKGGTGGQPGECNTAGGNWHGGVGAGWYDKGCDRLGKEHGERGGSRAQGWTGGRAGSMNSGNNGGPAPGAVGGFGGGGGGSEDNGASGGGGGYSGGGSGITIHQAGGGGGSYCSGESCSGVTGGNSNDDGIVKIIELSA